MNLCTDNSFIQKKIDKFNIDSFPLDLYNFRQNPITCKLHTNQTGTRSQFQEIGAQNTQRNSGPTVVDRRRRDKAPSGLTRPAGRHQSHTHSLHHCVSVQLAPVLHHARARI